MVVPNIFCSAFPSLSSLEALCQLSAPRSSPFYSRRQTLLLSMMGLRRGRCSTFVGDLQERAKAVPITACPPTRKWIESHLSPSSESRIARSYSYGQRKCSPSHREVLHITCDPGRKLWHSRLTLAHGMPANHTDCQVPRWCRRMWGPKGLRLAPIVGFGSMHPHMSPWRGSNDSLPQSLIQPCVPFREHVALVVASRSALSEILQGIRPFIGILARDLSALQQSNEHAAIFSIAHTTNSRRAAEARRSR